MVEAVLCVPMALLALLGGRAGLGHKFAVVYGISYLIAHKRHLTLLIHPDDWAHLIGLEVASAAMILLFVGALFTDPSFFGRYHPAKKNRSFEFLKDVS